jgi:hypothetical protein
MHWTLVTLLVLCGLCAASNVVQFMASRTVQFAGILICAAWAIQQSYWWATGEDSLALFIVCDAAVIAWFLTRRRRFGMTERLIAAAIPLTTALGVFAEINDGHTKASWWANYYLVAGQMLVGLPIGGLAARFFDRWKANLRHRSEWTDLNPREAHE